MKDKNCDKSKANISRTSKSYKNKKNIAKKLTENKDLGKPKNQKTTTLEIPDIWASKQNYIAQLSFLVKQGRHVLLHLAGTKNESNLLKNQEKDALSKQINEMKPLYDVLEQISVTYLGFPKKLRKKERMIISFFRNDLTINPKYPEQDDDLVPLNNKVQENLNQIKFQLDNVFYKELHIILQQLEGNETKIQEQIQKITQDILDFTDKLDDLSQANTIVKNLFIQLIIESKNDKLKQLESIVDKQKDTELVQLFKQLISQNSFRINQFITQLTQLFFENTIDDYSQFSNQQDIQQKEYQDDNQIYLSDS